MKWQQCEGDNVILIGGADQYGKRVAHDTVVIYK